MASREENELFGRALQRLAVPLADSIGAVQWLLYFVLGNKSKKPGRSTLGFEHARRAFLGVYQANGGAVPRRVAERFATKEELAKGEVYVVSINPARGTVKISR